MYAFVKSLVVASMVTSFSLNAVADEPKSDGSASKSPVAAHKEVPNMTSEQRSEHRSESRKAMREHVEKNLSPDEIKAMHKKVREGMEHSNANPDNTKPVSKPAN
jgi:hypothetical protein